MSYNKGGYAAGPQLVAAEAAKSASQDQQQAGPQNNAYSDTAFQGQASQVQTSEAPLASAVPQAPGSDLIDGLAGIVFAPGRAIVRLVNPEPGPKDLPMIVLISAGFWWAGWWAFNKYVLSDTSKTRLKALRKKIETTEIDEDDEEGDE